MVEEGEKATLLRLQQALSEKLLPTADANGFRKMIAALSKSGLIHSSQNTENSISGRLVSVESCKGCKSVDLVVLLKVHVCMILIAWPRK